MTIEKSTKLVILVALAVTLSVTAAPKIPEPESGSIPAQADSWHIYTVGPGGDGVMSVSLVLDARGYPHLGYHDIGQNSHLWYAEWTGSDWRKEMVDSSEEVGEYVSIALDSKGFPYISYYDWVNQDLKLAKWTGTTWKIEVVDSAGDIGRGTSIAIDKDDHPHISYTDWTTRMLKHAEWTGSDWSIENVASAGTTSSHTSIALNSTDYPHIAFYCAPPYSDLKYASWNGSSWNVETVDSLGYVGQYASLALDSLERPHIGYRGGIDAGVKYARWNESGWRIEVVDSSRGVGTWISLALDGGDNPHLSYQDYINQKLKYARRTDGNWTTEVVDSNGDTGPMTSIKIDRNDLPHIAYHGYDDVTFGNVRYATKADLQPPAVPILSYEPTTIDFGNLPPGTTANMTFDVWNSGEGVLGYNFSKDVPWITSVNPLSGSSTGEHDVITVSIDTTSLSAGPHTGSISIASNGGNGSIDVLVNITALTRRIALDIDPDTLNLKSRGKWITAYLIAENSSPEYIDASSLLLNDIVPPSWWDIQSNTTLMVKFDRAAVQAIVSISESVDIKVTGCWNDGETFEAHDTIRVISP